MSGLALNLTQVPIEKYILDTVPLEEIVAVLQNKLTDNFAEVKAEVVTCPDLTKEPFNLADKGLGGNPQIIDVGGPGFLLPLVDRQKCYDLRSVPELVGDEKSFILGAGGGPWPYVGVNCENILNMVVTKEAVVTPGSRIAKVDENEKCKVIKTPITEPGLCLLGNILSCRGETCQVLKVHCKKRTGKLDFTTSMRLALKEAFPNKVIGIGGVFVILKGKVKQHVMPDFSKSPINNEEQLNKWLRFYNMSAPLIACGTFVSRDPGVDLREQHFHSFGETEGGHYHYDTTPEEVEYLGIFTTGCTLLRADKPQTHATFGKD